MATYGTIYRMQFRDKKDLLWRVDFRLKNAGDTDTPLVLEYGGGEPITIDWNNSDENQFATIIGSKASITYYKSSDTDPSPETFIDIEEDEWLIDISKLPNNVTPVLFWRGFVKPDNNKYPWLPVPYSFTINAVDFTFSKGTTIDLTDTNLFLYDFITVGDLIKRTLFHSIGYEDSIAKILFSIKPDVIGTGLITKSLWLHTDAFYDFKDGAKFSYDALDQLLTSVDARTFYSAGSYWVQRVQDIGSDNQSIIVITPENTEGTSTDNYDISQPLGNSPSDTVIYLNQTQMLTVNAAIKKQRVNYPLQGINQIKNFDWRSNTQSPFLNWEGDVTGFYTRQGVGSLEDQFRIRIGDATGSTFRSIWSRIPVAVNQLVRLELKAKSYLTLPVTDTVTYGVFTKAVVVLVESGTIDPLRWLGTDGKWNNVTGGNVGEDEYYHISSNPKNNANTGTVEILSEPIPVITSIGSYEVLVVIVDSGINPTAPPGSAFYTELYPAFLRVYNDPYVRIQEDIINSKKYSLIPSDKEKFFLDIQDTGLSNTIFYDDAGTKKAIPFNNWDDKTIDETVLRGELDQQNKPGYSFDGDVFSNDLSFHHAITLTDFDNKIMMLLRDKYSIMSCVHSIYATEIMPIGAGIGTYTVTPLTQDE